VLLHTVVIQTLAPDSLLWALCSFSALASSISSSRKTAAPYVRIFGVSTDAIHCLAIGHRLQWLLVHVDLDGTHDIVRRYNISVGPCHGVRYRAIVYLETVHKGCS
jgi:hypothetical protein